MDVVITINEKDLMKNPDILDMVKGVAKGLVSTDAVSASAEPVDKPTELKPEAEEQKPQTTPEENTTEPITEPGAEITVSVEDVRAALAKVSRKHGAEKAKTILKEHGSSKVTDLAQEHYASVLKAAEEAL